MESPRKSRPSPLPRPTPEGRHRITEDTRWADLASRHLGAVEPRRAKRQAGAR